MLSLLAEAGNNSEELLGGLYADPEDNTPEFTKRIKKLRALIRDLNRVFSFILAIGGSRRTIMPKRWKSESDSTSSDTDIGVPIYLAGLLDPYDFELPLEVSFEDIAEELEDLFFANQGIEFPGTPNDRLAVELFWN
ncbi:hypothetical protein PG999_004309 [Apiospora kogelbergensis]|uniref:Uncharacterized protein n=1 Tax=Apiospora kogelbergensis TaxID=1337665 RepID=A0AAW0QZ13_9PEZI